MRDELIVIALNEAVDALGDIPAEICTEQQREAYRQCVAARDEAGEIVDDEDQES